MNYNSVMKKIFRTAACVAAFLSLAPLCACIEQEPAQNNNITNFYAMGTSATLLTPKSQYATEEEYEAFAQQVQDIIYETEQSLSANINTSYIYKFNQSAAGSVTPIDETTYRVLSEAKRVYNLTNGYYNPAVYHSVKLYGFPFTIDTIPESLPSDGSVNALKELASHFNEVELTEDNGIYYVKKPDFTVEVEGQVYSLAIDLGGIGKGWCADKVSALMASCGYDSGVFSFGGSTIAAKSYKYNESGEYTLKIRNPVSVFVDYFCDVKLQNKNLSTSGEYEQEYVIDGELYCHIIDPTTGSPIRTGIASATVIGGSATEDDALTTALCCMGKEKAVEFINAQITDRVVVMVYTGNAEEGYVREVITNAPDKITITDSDFVLANTVENGRIVLKDVA